MGIVMSVVNRQIRRINIENRARRVISQEKPTIAPKHPSSLKAIEYMEDSDLLKKELSQKNEAQHQLLKNIFVTSHDISARKSIFGKPSEEIRSQQIRSGFKVDQYGFITPDLVPEGKISLKQAMTILSNNQGDPVLYNASKISTDYKISEKDTVNIIRYFGVFKVRIPENKEKKPMLSEAKSKLAGFINSSSQKTVERKETKDTVVIVDKSEENVSKNNPL